MQMHDRNRKQPNALKPGAFTQMTILPGEDVRAFEKLHMDLIEEWHPIGPTEQDAVLTIAKGIWRKGRIQGFLLGKALACSLDPTHLAYDEVSALRGFCNLLEIAPDLLDKRLRVLSEEVRGASGRVVAIGKPTQSAAWLLDDRATFSLSATPAKLERSARRSSATSGRGTRSLT
jgi:hypothetical protein